MTPTFDAAAEDYDRWYDSADGRVIFGAELECLRLLCPGCPGRWLEVGVGTGRFASALGISEGIDPSSRMLEIAGTRGVHTTVGIAENLPCPDGSFDGILLALTLCFVSDSQQTLDECRRVLRPGGFLVIGIVPADSPWGRKYIDEASRGHSIYSLAHFRTASEIAALAHTSGFEVIGAASTLFWEPGQPPPGELLVETGIVPEAGFVGLRCVKASHGPVGAHNPGDRGL